MQPPPSAQTTTIEAPGSTGEHRMQEECGTGERARRFYDQQMTDRINPRMRELIGRMEMAFIATADGGGECDASFRAGPPGFVRVLDERTIAWPDYRGNGVMASAGNITENPHVGILFVDFQRDLVGLHVNGTVELMDPGELDARHPDDRIDIVPGRRAERWIVVTVEEAYIHCSKHIPRLLPAPRSRDWGTDDPEKKGGDHFGVTAERRDGA